MSEKLLHIARGDNRPRSRRHVRPAFSVLALAAGLVLLSSAPARGRWEVVRTVELPTVGHASASAELAPVPTDTPVPLPERASVPILMYHYVSELPADADRYRRDLTVLPENFREQLQYLADAGYHPITLTDLYYHFTQGLPLPEKPVVLTFDDGYRDAYDVVFPMLLDYGFPGTFFVLATPAHYESADYLTWGQMKEMSGAGMAIEGHGRDHVELRGRSYDYVVYQTLGIQEAIHYHTGRLPRFFCYPAGQYDASVIAVLQSEGYWGAVTTQWGREHTLEGFYEMGRVRVRGSDTLESFVDKLED
jgi:peptidoglycan/xylan/chitin deacetylase (PgdA/CDA1 family)